MVFEIVSYKVTSKTPLLFDIVFCLYQVHMKGNLILQIIHISVKRMAEERIEGLSRGNNMGGIMMGLNPSQLVHLGEVSMERSDKYDPWLRSWWGDTLTAM